MARPALSRRFPVIALTVAAAVLLVRCSTATGPQSQGQKGPKAARLVIEQPNVFVAVDDSLELLVDAFDTSGNSIDHPGVTWRTRQSSTATVSGQGVIRGVRAGQTWIVAESGTSADSAAVTVVPHLTTTVTPHVDTLTSLGQTVTLHAQSTDSAGNAVQGNYVWVIRDTTIAMITQSGVATAHQNGATSVLAIERGGSTDSCVLVVAQRVTKLTIKPTRAVRPLMRQQQFQVSAFDSGGTLITNPHLVWTSRLPSVATVDSTGLATAVAVGTDTIFATTGTRRVFAAFIATPLPSLHFSQDTIGLGVGQESETFPNVIPDTAGFDQAFNATITVSDSTTASLPGASQVVNVYPPGPGYFRPIGHRLGIATVTVSAPRWKSATAVIAVTRPRLVISRSAPPNPPVLSNEPQTVTVWEEDSRGNINGSIVGLRFAIQSSNTAALIPDNDTVFATGAGASFRAFAVGNGQSTFTVSALSSANYAGDTITLTAAPAKLLFEDLDGPIRDAIIALGQKVIEEGALNPLFWVDVGCFAHITVPLTITQKHPERLRVSPLTASVAGGNCGLTRVALDFTGLSLGADTLIAAAPGFQPDTFFVHVTTPLIKLNPPLAATDSVGVAESLGLYQADSAGESWDLTGPVPVLLTSSDTAVARMTCDTVILGGSTFPPGCAGASLFLVGAGTATIGARDLSGHSLPFTSTIAVAPASLTAGVDNTSERPVSLGFDQDLGAPGHFFAGLPVNQVFATIHVRSSNPAVAMPTVSDTAPVWSQSLVAFDVNAGTVPGSAWIVVSGRGMLSDSIPIVVGQPTFGVYAGGDGVSANSTTAIIELLDQEGNPRYTTRSVTAWLQSSNPGILATDSASVTIPAGSYSSAPFTVQLLAPGSAAIIASDSSTVGQYGNGASGLITVIPVTGTSKRLVASGLAPMRRPTSGATPRLSVPRPAVAGRAKARATLRRVR